MAMYARVSLKGKYSSRAHDDVNTSSLKENPSTERLAEADRRIPLRPPLNEASKPNDQSRTQGDSKQEIVQEETDDSKTSIVYAELSKLKPNRKQKPPAQLVYSHVTKPVTV